MGREAGAGELDAAADCQERPVLTVVAGLSAPRRANQACIDIGLPLDEPGFIEGEFTLRLKLPL